MDDEMGDSAGISRADKAFTGAVVVLTGQAVIEPVDGMNGFQGDIVRIDVAVTVDDSLHDIHLFIIALPLRKRAALHRRGKS